MYSIIFLTVFITSVGALKCFRGEAYLGSLTDSVVHVSEYKAIDRAIEGECRSCIVQHYVPASDAGRRVYVKAIKMGCSLKSCQEQELPGSGFCQQSLTGLFSFLGAKITYLNNDAAVHQCCWEQELANYGINAQYDLLGQSKEHLKSLLPDFNTTTSSGEFRTYKANGEYLRYVKRNECKGKVKIIKIRDSEAGGLPSIKNEEYFHGFVPAVQTQNLLVNIGNFLVRQGTKGEGKHSSKEKLLISVRIKKEDLPVGPPVNLNELNKEERAAAESAINLEKERLAAEVLHLPIKYSRRARLHYINKFGFRLASGLIEYHRRHQHPIDEHGTIIERPIKRASWQLNHEQISRTKKLGDGAFGDVFMGMLRSGLLGRIPVAVKTINGTISDAENEKLFDEAMLMKSLRHPNIIHLVGVASNEDPLMVVMEFASQGSVLDLVQGKKPPVPSLYHRCYYSYGAAKGLAYLEGKKIIHRDIAARNVLVGSDGEAKISDFGLSLSGSFKKEKTLNKVPVRYLAPETLHSAVYTHKSDVWTYGVYVWEVFHNGVEPFEGFERTADVKTFVKKGGRLSNTCTDFPLFLWKLISEVFFLIALITIGIGMAPVAAGGDKPESTTKAASPLGFFVLPIAAMIYNAIQ